MQRTLIALIPGLSSITASAPDIVNPIVTLPISEVHWNETSESVAFAALEMQHFTRQYMAIVRLSGSIKSPVHIKSATMFGTMIAGEMVYYPKELAAYDRKIISTGGFYKIPANIAHVSECVSAEECIRVLYQDGPFDFVPVVN